MNTPVTPITVADRPDAIFPGSSLGPVTWRQYCEVERDRLLTHRANAVVVPNHSGTRIFVGVIRSAKGVRS